MTTTIRAVALRRFGHLGRIYDKGKIFSLPENQFEDWLAAGLVQQAPPPPRRAKKPGK